jgi:hypothetical protein
MLLLRAVGVKPARLRIFLTSRPEGEITEVFQEFLKRHASRSCSGRHSQYARDIFAYLTSEFAKIGSNTTANGTDWPGKAIIEELAQTAAPSFIFAATVCRFIGDKDEIPSDQLKII